MTQPTDPTIENALLRSILRKIHFSLVDYDRAERWFTSWDANAAKIAAALSDDEASLVGTILPEVWSDEWVALNDLFGPWIMEDA